MEDSLEDLESGVTAVLQLLSSLLLFLSPGCVGLPGGGAFWATYTLCSLSVSEFQGFQRKVNASSITVQHPRPTHPKVSSNSLKN